MGLTENNFKIINLVKSIVKTGTNEHGDTQCRPTTGILVEKEKFSDVVYKCQCLSVHAVMTANYFKLLIRHRKMNVLQTSDACAAVRIVDCWWSAAEDVRSRRLMQ